MSTHRGSCALMALALFASSCKSSSGSASSEQGTTGGAPAATAAKATASAPPAAPSPSASAANEADSVPCGDDPELCTRDCLAGSARACSRAVANLKDDPAARLKVNAAGCALSDPPASADGARIHPLASHWSSCTRLARMYLDGDGTPSDPKKAAELFRKACDGRFGTGCVRLGVLYDDGKGVEHSRAKAKELWELGCTLGDAQGCSLRAIEHQECVLEGNPDRKAALSWLEKACKLGDSDSCKTVDRMRRDADCRNVTVEDLLAAPKKWIGRQVMLRDVAVMRSSPTAGYVGARGARVMIDGIRAEVGDDEEVRKAWRALPSGPATTGVRAIGATVERPKLKGVEEVRLAITAVVR